MPHCIVEHSINLDSDLFVEKVFMGALSTGLFEPDGRDIKVRALGYSSYMTGPKRSDFIHVSLKILSGRTPKQKLSLSDAVIEELVALAYNDVSITVEVVDMDRDSYRKVI
ncbi:5-carboxymethyl-2-hydroxymuconate Delta-isomerase [Arcobacter sp.]|uniref:5-carboxymethyl-2-hydroxymuconate Delta-isomerase n=1 Tax=Arcobacter sp. TaxID=1872629 RepID=UPI003D0E0DF4